MGDVGGRRRWFAASNALLVVEGPIPGCSFPYRRGNASFTTGRASVRLARPEAVLLDADCVADSIILPRPTRLNSTLGSQYASHQTR